MRPLLLASAMLLFTHSAVAEPGLLEELTFDDGLLPSAKGWLFQGRDYLSQPLTESQVATVSNGILRINTVQFGHPATGGISSDETIGYWAKNPGANPEAFFLEIGMRAEQPDGERSGCSGLFGNYLYLQPQAGHYGAGVTLMPRQVTLVNAPGATCLSEHSLSIDGTVFHAYRVEVRGRDVRFFIDGAFITQQILDGISPESVASAVFGDGSTSGGNAIAEIDFIRIGNLAGSDADGDAVPDSSDNCPQAPNRDQADFDLDGIGDACDAHTGPPTNKEQCRKDGWRRFDTPHTFKNQGDCIRSV